jgi:glycosyltransferase involved in cell wall biosynthesis
LHIGVCHSDGFNIIKKTDYIISVGKKLLDNLLASGFKKEKSTCINNMIDLDDTHNRTPSTTTKIGFLGRFDNCKGADLFIEALSKVKSNGINFKAIIGGDGEEREKLTRIAIDRGIQESIEMIGWVEDKEKFFNNIDILCVPSREESFGIVILEAMKYGVPVIASNVSGPSEIITHGTDGLLFKSEDIEDLAAKIKELFSSDELRTKLRNNGSKTVQQYDISKVSKQLNDTIATWVKDNK